jgi:hypothetical protein
MLKRLKFAFAGALAIVFQLLAAGSAWAHSLTINATAVCSQSGPVINYTATAWSTTDAQAAHPQVQILVNGVVVDTGVFQLSNGNSFSGTVAAPTGSQAVVGALASGPWSNGVLGGQSASTTVTVPTDCVTGTGRFTGGGKQVNVGGVDVTRGLTIHCDLRLSNNLEVNWSGGNHFHMTEHLTTVACTDDPLIIQTPPRAPLDTLIGVGTGRYNGVNGYTIRFTLLDAGEPGSLDRMAIRIFETANPANVVLNVPLVYLTGGNLQAHYDQPHKRN